MDPKISMQLLTYKCATNGGLRQIHHRYPNSGLFITILSHMETFNFVDKTPTIQSVAVRI